MSDHYTWAGGDAEPVPEPDILKWARWFESADRQLCRDEVGTAVVSTVFLGVDHNFTSLPGTVLWESMVFGGPLNDAQERYFSRAEALIGHARIVAQVREFAGQRLDVGGEKVKYPTINGIYSRFDTVGEEVAGASEEDEEAP